MSSYSSNEELNSDSDEYYTNEFDAEERQGEYEDDEEFEEEEEGDSSNSSLPYDSDDSDFDINQIEYHIGDPLNRTINSSNNNQDDQDDNGQTRFNSFNDKFYQINKLPPPTTKKCTLSSYMFKIIKIIDKSYNRFQFDKIIVCRKKIYLNDQPTTPTITFNIIFNQQNFNYLKSLYLINNNKLPTNSTTTTDQIQSKFIERLDYYNNDNDKDKEFQNEYKPNSIKDFTDSIHCILLNRNSWSTDLVLPGFEFLTSLSLIDSNLSNVSIQLGNLKQLKYLNLTKNNFVTSSSLNGLSEMKELECLILDQNLISNLTRELFSPLNKLKTLSLVKTNLFCLIPTISALQCNENLQHLYFKSNSNYESIGKWKRIKKSIPIYNNCYYREYCITMLSNSLISLDGLVISDKERKDSLVMVENKFSVLQDTSKWRNTFKHFNQINNQLLHNEISTDINQIPTKKILKSFEQSNDLYNKNPKQTEIKSVNMYPRQFEYNPNRMDILVVGSSIGSVDVIDLQRDKSLFRYQVAHNTNILGLSWLRGCDYSKTSSFLVGTEYGTIQLIDYSKGSDDRSFVVCSDYPTFNGLTSLHCNSNSTSFIASGSPRDIAIYDLERPTIVSTIHQAHSMKINVVKYSNYDPHTFVSSSFDGTVKKWDTRCDQRKPCWSVNGYGQILMSTFSPDDSKILVSSYDNNIYQLNSLDGSLYSKFEIPQSGKEHNYSRSYYNGDGSLVIVGSCDENCIRIFNSKTSTFFRDIVLINDKPSDDPNEITGILKGVLSLRCNPFNSNEFCILKTGVTRFYKISF